MVAVAVPTLLRLSLDRLARLLEPRRRRATTATVDEILGTVDAAIAALRPLARRGCLTLGVTRYDALRRAGIDADLCFGVAIDRPDPIGHCWLELDGAALAEPQDPRNQYRQTYRLRAPVRS